MEEKKRQFNDQVKVSAFSISSDKDIVKVREYAREIAEQIGFAAYDRTLIATAVSELCRNVVEHAQEGEIKIVPVNKNPAIGLKVTVTDTGPGIFDISKAMQDGYSTGRGMGMGLPGTKRIMDEFKLISNPGKGTQVVISKWIK